MSSTEGERRFERAVWFTQPVELGDVSEYHERIVKTVAEFVNEVRGLLYHVNPEIRHEVADLMQKLDPHIILPDDFDRVAEPNPDYVVRAILTAIEGIFEYDPEGYFSDHLPLHLYSVGSLAKVLALRLGMNNEAKLIAQCGALHDNGKAEDLNYSIIIKPEGANLTPYEREGSREHAIFGFNILRHFRAAREHQFAALGHHEKLDGSGYPMGLRAHQIPMYIRVVTVADIFDAMVSKRPDHERGKTLNETVEVLRSESSIKLDAGVVDAMLGILDERGMTKNGKVVKQDMRVTTEQVLNLS